MDELNGIFQRQNMSFPEVVDIVDHGCHRGGFSASGRPGKQNQSPGFLADFFKIFRQIQLFECQNVPDRIGRTAIEVPARAE